MADPEPETPVIDRLVDEVLRGQRAVPFAPGTLNFVAANMLFLIGGALLCAASMPALLQSVAVPALAQLAGLGLVLPSLFVPAFLVVNGHAAGHRAFVRICHIWLAAAVAASVAAWIGALAAPPAACGVAGLFLSASYAVVRTTGYRTFALWKRRLRERRPS